ncbi:MAG: prepilin-type N-terminal cleavage/methylation domain-containing protein [Acidobacteria bacterium]|nr:prepilin-type N-terminal cleavage/methylation domain-containing protein [Acidobacteriota bacterium]
MKSSKQQGFSLVEMLISMVVLLVVVGAVLQLMSQSQQRSVATATVQDATSMLRDSVDQMVRDIRLAGYPAPNSYPCPPPAGATYGACLTYLNSGYIAGGILVANPYAIQFEADTDGDNRAEMFDYELQVPTGGATGGCAALTENDDLSSPTLMRSMVVKNADGTVPAVDFQPFLENIQNCTLSTAIFIYCPAPPTSPTTAPFGPGCPTMTNYPDSSLPAPRNTRIVMIRLQVQSAVRDPQTGQFLNVEQYGLAERINPDQ